MWHFNLRQGLSRGPWEPPRGPGWAQGGTIVHADSTTPIFHPATEWMDASKFQKVRVTQDNRGLIGVIEIGAAYQTANVMNSPDSATLLDSTASADGMVFPSDWNDLSTIVKGKQLIRFGRLAKLTSGSTLALGGNWTEIEYAED